MGNTEKITVAALAREAGVSPATVSRVLNQRTDLVTEKTIQAVHQAMERLGYQLPDTKPSVPREHPVIIFNVPNISNLFYTEVTQGAMSSANAHNCHLLLNQSPLDYSSLEDFTRLIRRVNAAGAIILNTMSADILQQLGKLVPIVQCSEYNPDVDLPYVSIDNCRAAKEATQYIISCGRNKIAFINGPRSYQYAHERERGFLMATQNAGLTIPPNWIVHLPDINYEMAYSAICQLLNSDVKPNAFFTASDTLAAAVLQAAKRYHYNVPKDILVVGFDNTEISSMCTPTITTVSQPKFQLGFSACEMLLKLIRSPGTYQHSIFLETELIVRESTGSVFKTGILG